MERRHGSRGWWADPDGKPLTVGERITTRAAVIANGALYRSEEGEWVVEEPPNGPLTWGVGMLSGQIPAVGTVASGSDVRATRLAAGNGYTGDAIPVDESMCTTAINPVTKRPTRHLAPRST